MENYLILICNGSKALFYSADKKYPKDKLQYVTELADPKSREKGTELVSGRPGRYQTSHKAVGTYEPDKTPKEQEKDYFAKNIAEHLEKQYNNKKFHSLTIITPPHFFGLLEKHFSKHVSETISHVIQKDYTHFTEPELREVLQQEKL